jgi:hypothetical protein
MHYFERAKLQAVRRPVNASAAAVASRRAGDLERDLHHERR